MASRTIHDKIPHNVRVNKAAADVKDPERDARAAMLSTRSAYIGARAERNRQKRVQRSSVEAAGITSGGERFKTRYAELAKVAKVAADGLKAIQTIKDSAEAATNPELAALVNDPKWLAVIGKVVSKIGQEVNKLTASIEPVENSANRKVGPDYATGDAAFSRPVLTAEDMARVERARAKLSRLKTAEALGDAGDIVRARFGLEPRAYDSDAMERLMDRLEGKAK